MNTYDPDPEPKRHRQMFSDPEEYEKWKARGWRVGVSAGESLAVIGGALLLPGRLE